MYKRQVLIWLAFGFSLESFALASEKDTVPVSDSNPTAGLENLHQSATNGSAESQFELGLIYEYGRGVDQNDSKAAHWYEKSANQGFPQAQYRLGVLCDNGWGKPIDKEKAFNLYLSAAEKGVELAQHDLAIAYFHGSGTSKNLMQAYKWLKIAELSGNPLMQKHLHLVSKEMSLDEIQSASYLARYWLESSAAESGF